MTTHEKLRQLTLTSLFIALVVLFGMTPLGLIPVGTLNATILHIPVIIGVIALGLKPGLILGLAFGLVSTLRAFGRAFWCRCWHISSRACRCAASGATAFSAARVWSARSPIPFFILG